MRKVFLLKVLEKRPVAPHNRPVEGSSPSGPSFLTPYKVRPYKVFFVAPMRHGSRRITFCITFTSQTDSNNSMQKGLKLSVKDFA